MKKQFTTFMIALLLSLFGSTLYAQKVGDEFTMGELVYRITEFSPTKKEVVISKFKEKYYPESERGVLTIPATVKDSNNNEYEVVDVVSGGFFTNASYSFYYQYVTEFQVDPNSNYFSAENGVLFNKDKTTLISFPKYDSQNRTEYTIPETVTRIGNLAFVYRNKLTKISMSNNVLELGDAAFSGCSALESINLSTNLTHIYDYCFYRTKITEIKLPKTLIYISETCFWNQTTLNIIKLDPENPNLSLDEVNGVLFNKNKTDLILARKNILSYDIPETVKRIGIQAFSYAEKLEHITIPNSVNDIGNRAFYGCRELKSPIVIPEGVERINDLTFDGCSKIPSVKLPTTLNYIGSQAFSGCASLPSVSIPENVTYIGPNAFKQCISITSVDIPKTSKLITIGSNAFGTCSSLPSIKLPETVETIGSAAFSYCGKLTSINIPSKVTRIEERTFYSCKSLPSINLHEGITNIGVAAFGNCENLTSINIPSKVTKIEELTFKECSSLPSINLHEGITSIGVSAFEKCTALPLIVIPSTVTEIGAEAFNGCGKLKDIISFVKDPESIKKVIESYFNNQGIYISKSPFRDFQNNKITAYPENSTLYVPKGTKEYYEGAYWTDYTKNIKEFGDLFIDAKPKVYDGTTKATIPANATLGDVILPIDAISLQKNTSTTAAFSNADAGEKKTVNITGYSVEGKGKEHYISLTARGTITQAPLTITVKDMTKVEDGKVVNNFELLYDGFVNGENATVALQGTPIFEGAGATATAVGTYPVSVSGLTAKNYKITFLPGTLTIGGDYVWVGTQSTDWNRDANWQGNIVPENVIREENTNVFESVASIKFDANAVNDLHVPILSAGQYIEINNLTNNSSKNLVIPAGAALVVNGDIIGSATAAQADKIVVKADATNPNGTFRYTKPQTVYGTVEMYARGSITSGETVEDIDIDSPTQGQNLDSSPRWQFFGIPVESIVPTPSFDYSYLREYSEAYNGSVNPGDGKSTWYAKWKNVGSHNTLSAFKGYEISQEAPKTYVVKGKLNNGMTNLLITADASKTDTKSTDVKKIYYGIGQNIFGNSYTSAIDIDKFFEYNLAQNPSLATNIEQTVYLYNTGSFGDWQNGKGTDGNNSVDKKESIIAGKYLAIPYNSAKIIPAKDIYYSRIPSMQGFLLKYIIDHENKPVIEDVVVRQTNYPHLTLKVDAGDYGGYFSTANNYKNREPQMVKAEQLEAQYLKVNLESKSTIDNLWLIKNSKTTDGFDNGWDGKKSFGTNTAYIYSQTVGGNMQIDVTNNIDNREITFVSNSDKEYTLRLFKSNLDVDYPTLSLLDMETQEIVPLVSDTTTYHFTSSPNRVSKRFKIVNSSNITTEDFLSSNNLSLRYSKGNLFITNQTKAVGKLLVVDLSGRLLEMKDVAVGNSTERLQLSSGVYILRLKANNESTTLKVVIE